MTRSFRNPLLEVPVPVGLHALLARAARGEWAAMPEFVLAAGTGLMEVATGLRCPLPAAESVTNAVICHAWDNRENLTSRPETPTEAADEALWRTLVGVLVRNIRERCN